MIRYYLYLAKFDPQRANLSLRSKSIEYMYEWRNKPLDNWNEIEKFWCELWKTKEEYEEELK